MKLDLIEDQAFNFREVDMVKMYWFLGETWVFLHILIIRKKNILVLGKRPTQGLEHTLTAEKMYSIKFTLTRKKFCWSLHYSGANSYLFVNGTEIIKFKATDSETVASSLYLGNIANDLSVDNMKKTGFNNYAYDFSIDCDAAVVDNNKDIHNYLMKKNKMI